MQHLGLVTHAKFPLGLDGAVLCISSGSLIDFQGDAIVNSANLYLANGGGVNGCVCKAGGPRLLEAMEATPPVEEQDGRLIRCPTGEARLTTGGNLKAAWCIHTVAPNYVEREGLPTKESDGLLTSAYRNSMLHAANANAKTVAFSLLSSGIFCGKRGLQEVLNIGVAALRAGAYAGLEEVHLVTFNGKEIPELELACITSDARCVVQENSSLVHPESLAKGHTHHGFLGENGSIPHSLNLLQVESEGVIFLGNRKVAENVEALRLLNVSHVVNCALSQVSSPLHEVREKGVRKVKYCLIDLDDAPVTKAHDMQQLDEGDIPFDARAPDAFSRAVEFIDDAMNSRLDDGNGGPVIFVHCAGGVSRSCCVVLAYLISKIRLPLCNAYAQIKKVRPVVAPNAGFFRLLLDMEKEEHGFETMQRPKTVHQRDYKYAGFVGHPLQFLAIGDWGYPSDKLKSVASAMAKEAERINSRFVLGLGDNFYPSGVRSTKDELFRTYWQDIFLIHPSLNIPWKMVLGNHDYQDNPQAQIDFTTCPRNTNGLWQMSDCNYRFSWPLGGCKYIEFFALDTNGCQNSVRRAFTDARENLYLYIKELDEMLARSRATWKVVFAHHPMYTKGIGHGVLGRCLRDNTYVVKEYGKDVVYDGYDLEKVLIKHHVHAYITGHEHVFQHHFAGGVGHFVCGASGAEPVGFYKGEDTQREDGPAWIDQGKNSGFLRLEVTPELMAVMFINRRGEVLRTAKRKLHGDWFVDDFGMTTHTSHVQTHVQSRQYSSYRRSRVMATE